MNKNERNLVLAALIEANQAIQLLDEEIVANRNEGELVTGFAPARQSYAVTMRDRSSARLTEAIEVMYGERSFWQRLALRLESFAASLYRVRDGLEKLISELEQQNGKGKRL